MPFPIPADYTLHCGLVVSPPSLVAAILLFRRPTQQAYQPYYSFLCYNAAIFKDRSNEMPDEILCRILFFLPMNEAVRSSILSHRWRYMWKTSLYFMSCLTLDVLSMRGSDYPNNMFGGFEPRGFRGDSNLLLIERLKFVKWADQILQLDYGPMIDSFRLRFDLNKDFASHIDRWISVAISRRVQNFDIDLFHFFRQGFHFPSLELYTFPDWLFTKETGSLVKCLSLSCCILRPFAFSYFSSLLDMKLDHVVINQDSFDCLLSNTPNLEKLRLVKCRRLVRLKISGSLLKLENLAILYCTISECVEIDAINLTRFEYWGDPVKFSFLNAPKLSTVIIFLQYHNIVMQNMASYLRKLEWLMLVVDSMMKPFVPIQLANLKKLVLMVLAFKETLWGLTPMLHAAPLLDTLELNLHLLSFSDKDCEEMLKPTDSPHHNLKNITISGFRGSAHEVEFTTYLLNNTPALKKIIIFYSKENCYSCWCGHYTLCLTGPSKKPGAVDAQRKLEEQSKQQLMEVVPPGVEIQFL